MLALRNWVLYIKVAPNFDIPTATIFVILRSHIQFHFRLFIQDVDFNCTQEIIAFHNVWLYMGSQRNVVFVACKDFKFTSLIKKFLPLNQMVLEARHKPACWWHNEILPYKIRRWNLSWFLHNHHTMNFYGKCSYSSTHY